MAAEQQLRGPGQQESCRPVATCSYFSMTVCRILSVVLLLGILMMMVGSLERNRICSCDSFCSLEGFLRRCDLGSHLVPFCGSEPPEQNGIPNKSRIERNGSPRRHRLRKAMIFHFWKMRPHAHTMAAVPHNERSSTILPSCFTVS